MKFGRRGRSPRLPTFLIWFCLTNFITSIKVKITYREWFSFLKSEYPERKRKGGNKDGKAEGFEGPSEDSEGKEDQLDKESHLAC